MKDITTDMCCVSLIWSSGAAFIKALMMKRIDHGAQFSIAGLVSPLLDQRRKTCFCTLTSVTLQGS